MPASVCTILRRGTLLWLAITAIDPARAEDRRWYVEGNLGRTEVEEFVDGISLDDSATSFRLATGFRFVPYLGLEAAYTSLGTVATDFTDIFGVPLTLEAKVDGFELALVGRLPLGRRFALFGRLGNLWWSSEVSVGGIGDGENGNDLFYGAGAEFGLSDWIALTGGWQRYELDDVGIDAFTLGAQLRFGEQP